MQTFTAAFAAVFCCNWCCWLICHLQCDDQSCEQPGRELPALVADLCGAPLPAHPRLSYHAHAVRPRPGLTALAAARGINTHNQADPHVCSCSAGSCTGSDVSVATPLFRNLTGRDPGSNPSLMVRLLPGCRLPAHFAAASRSAQPGASCLPTEQSWGIPGSAAQAALRPQAGRQACRSAHVQLTQAADRGIWGCAHAGVLASRELRPLH
jgi:hypothetical protein